MLQKSKHIECGFIYSVVNRRYASGNSVDLVVIGSGPGGYVAAIKAAQLGLNVSVNVVLSRISLYLNIFFYFVVCRPFVLKKILHLVVLV